MNIFIKLKKIKWTEILEKMGTIGETFGAQSKFEEVFKYYTDLFEEDKKKLESLSEQFLNTETYTVERITVVNNFIVALEVFSNHMDNYINFLDDNEEMLFKQGLTEAYMHQIKNNVRDEYTHWAELVKRMKDNEGL